MIINNYKDLQQYFINELDYLYDNEEIIALLKNIIIHYQPQYINTNTQLDEATITNSLAVLGNLKKGIPLQHILGKAYFYNLEFKVNKHTLIPRPETEELVHLIINNHKNQLINILDIGSGSGCIPITLKKNLPRANVFSFDISVEALEVAQENADSNQTDVVFFIADALNLNPELFPKYDVIVSNPPYIKQDEKPQMHQNVLDHEPNLALFVENDNPLLFYDKISSFALTNLKKDGFLYFEINQYLATETKELLNNKGFDVELLKDINGNFRMIKAWVI